MCLLVFASTVSHRLGDKFPGCASWRDVLAGVISDQEISVLLKSNYAATMVLRDLSVNDAKHAGTGEKSAIPEPRRLDLSELVRVVQSRNASRRTDPAVPWFVLC